MAPLVNSEGEEDREEKWIGQNDISEDLFKEKLVVWLRENNLTLTTFNNIPSSFKDPNDDDVIEIGMQWATVDSRFAMKVMTY